MDKATAVARRAIESTYKGRCDIYEFKKVKEPWEETIVKEVKIAENQPCKLSKRTINATEQTDSENVIKYAPQLFISPDIKINAGSKIVVRQHGVTREFKQSGEPFVYGTHQEIILQRIDKA